MCGQVIYITAYAELGKSPLETWVIFIRGGWCHHTRVFCQLENESSPRIHFFEMEKERRKRYASKIPAGSRMYRQSLKSLYF